MNNGRLMLPTHTIYKPNRSGNGSALEIDLAFNSILVDEQSSSLKYEDKKDCLFLKLAKQLTPMSQGQNATFDWKNAVQIKLGYSDISEFAAVMAGIKEAAGPESRGEMYHRNATHNTRIIFARKPQDKGGGFNLYVSQQNESTKEKTFECFINLTRVEAYAFKQIFDQSLFFIPFSRNLARLTIDLSHATAAKKRFAA